MKGNFADVWLASFIGLNQAFHSVRAAVKAMRIDGMVYNTITTSTNDWYKFQSSWIDKGSNWRERRLPNLWNSEVSHEELAISTRYFQPPMWAPLVRAWKKTRAQKWANWGGPVSRCHSTVKETKTESRLQKQLEFRTTLVDLCAPD